MNPLDDNQTFNNSQSDNLIFIDTNLSNYQSLIPDTNNGAVLLIDSQNNGIEQITKALEQYNDLDSISIFSHGDIGVIQLGDVYLSNDNLNSYQEDIAAWGNALSAEGDLVLYGCNVGANQAGSDFVDRLANLTGADVAASNDLTGNAFLGGDWTLEVATGIIEIPTFSLNNYGHLLDLKFNFTYGENVTTEQKVAIEVAGKMWSEYLTDDVTLNIHIETAKKNDLPEGVIGAALPFFELDHSYSSVRSALTADVTSNLDRTAIDNLEQGSTWSAATDWLNLSKTIDINKVAMTKANAKALGLVNPNSTELDGTITFNDLVGTDISWQYDYFSSQVGSNKLDFTSVAIHEIGHILGFTSIVDGIKGDTPDNNMLAGGATTMDLFRYSSFQNSSTNLIPRVLDQGYTIFSVDRGRHNFASFAGGSNYDNNSFQASHWNRMDKNHSWSQGIMDPFLQLDTRRRIQTQDIRLMDSIGWDLRYNHEQWLNRNNYIIEARSIAAEKGNTNLNLEIHLALQDWRWARRGARSGFAQEGNIIQYLVQEGFFNVGTFRQSFDFDSVNSLPNNNSQIVIDNQSDATQLTSNRDDLLTDSFEPDWEIQIQNIVKDNSEIDYAAMLAVITEDFSAAELSQLSLEDLAQLIKSHSTENL